MILVTTRTSFLISPNSTVTKCAVTVILVLQREHTNRSRYISSIPIQKISVPVSSKTLERETRERKAISMREEGGGGGSSDGGDPQRIKRAAAASYDYDGDPRWSDYWSNVLIPPNVASRSEVVEHFKRKFYQRFIVRIPNLRIFEKFDLVTCSL